MTFSVTKDQLLAQVVDAEGNVIFKTNIDKKK
jgi:tartrate-resistant acid phosphatase type 5